MHLRAVRPGKIAEKAGQLMHSASLFSVFAFDLA